MFPIKRHFSGQVVGLNMGIMIAPSSNSAPTTTTVISLSKWLQQVGVTNITGWRWRKKGWLKTVNIAGRQYLTQEAIEEFHRRVVAGEFAKEHKTPSRKNAAV